MPDENKSCFIPLMKVDVANRLVYGAIACEEADSSGEIMDYASSKAAFQKWSDDQFRASGGKSYGNVRSMHSRIAAGKISSPLHFDDELKKISAVAKITDDSEWEKCLDGTFTGFSPGGGYAKIWQDPGNPKMKRYTPRVIEVSIVDSPCMKSATFEMVKADGSTELVKFKEPAPYEGPIQGFKAQDGTFFTKKVAAIKHDEALVELAKAEAMENTPEHPALKKLKNVEDSLEKLETGAEPEKKDDPAEPVKVKFKPSADLAKRLCEVASLAQLSDHLEWLKVNIEGECPEIGALSEKVSGIVTDECEAINKDCSDDMSKILELPEEHVKRLEKFSAALSKRIKISDELQPDVNPPAGELAKMSETLKTVTDDLSKEREKSANLEKVVTGLDDGLEKLAKRLDTMERQPMPGRGAIRAVDRGAERQANQTVNTPAKKETEAEMPAGLSPREQRIWTQNQRNKTH